MIDHLDILTHTYLVQMLLLYKVILVTELDMNLYIFIYYFKCNIMDMIIHIHEKKMIHDKDMDQNNMKMLIRNIFNHHLNNRHMMYYIIIILILDLHKIILMDNYLHINIQNNSKYNHNPNHNPNHNIHYSNLNLNSNNYHKNNIILKDTKININKVKMLYPLMYTFYYLITSNNKYLLLNITSINYFNLYNKHKYRNIFLIQNMDKIILQDIHYYNNSHHINNFNLSNNYFHIYIKCIQIQMVLKISYII